MSEAKIPRFMVTATGSGTGKTTIVCALLKALINKGLRVSAFKSGPDYIDPMFHSRVVGAKSRNIDLFMLGKETARYLVAKNAQHTDVAVFEGVMGYYDGLGKTDTSSAYDVARTCQLPTVLVVNGKGAALSIAAQLKGFKEFREDSGIAGAIINNVSPMSYAYYKDIIEKESGVRLLGYFPRMENCNFESRHLGLVTAEEIGNLREIVERLAEQAMKSVDLDALLALAASAHPLPYIDMRVEKIAAPKIAVAMDKAFCFYYQDSLDLLAELGAELIYFSPLADAELPVCDGLILGGGYPELYARQLAANSSMLVSIKKALTEGLPCFAECGGFMYLLEKFIGDDDEFKWVGVLPGASRMTAGLKRFGYVHLQAQADNLLCSKGGKINAHEFHYSDSTCNGSAFVAEKASGKGSWECINAFDNIWAGYPHLHLWGNTSFAVSFVKKCAKYACASVKSEEVK